MQSICVSRMLGTSHRPGYLNTILFTSKAQCVKTVEAKIKFFSPVNIYRSLPQTLLFVVNNCANHPLENYRNCGKKFPFRFVDVSKKIQINNTIKTLQI
uniref:Uncharacterized protein n=1 Tax=Anguilla anguilla TaxID=7936 RepID=A0A0E9WTL5_ANGAN